MTALPRVLLMQPKVLLQPLVAQSKMRLKRQPIKMAMR